MIKSSFDYANRLNVQSCGFDYVMLDGTPKIVEISYCYSIEGYDDCVGYWDKNLIFHEGKFDSTNWMIDSVMKQIDNK